MVFPPVTDGSTPPADEYPVTPDGRYVVVRGRLGERPTRVSQRRSESVCAGGEGGDAPANRANLYDEVNPKVIGGLGGCQGAARPAGREQLPAAHTHLRYIQRDGVTREGGVGSSIRRGPTRPTAPVSSSAPPMIVISSASSFQPRIAINMPNSSR